MVDCTSVVSVTSPQAQDVCVKMATIDIQNENYHAGFLIRDYLRRRPDEICQIDAATGESETNASVLRRSIQLAKCFRKLGAKLGDVLALGGRNHVDLHIPFYAAIMNGYPVAGVDPQFKFNEIKAHLEKSTPRIAFCQIEHLEDYLRAVKELGLNTKVICFDDGDHSIKKFIDQYGDDDCEKFEPEMFTINHIVWLMSTGGTTGVIKLAIVTHRAILLKLQLLMQLFKGREIDPETKNVYGLNISPVQWFTGFMNAINMPLSNQTKIMSSAPNTPEHIIDLITKYKPITLFMSTSLAVAILKGDKECDLSGSRVVILGGGKVSANSIIELRKKVPPTTLILEAYGQTENLGPLFHPSPFAPVGSIGKDKVSPEIQVKLVDPETGKEVTAPNEPGELWNKSSAMFAGYYKDPEETAAAFSEDGWFKTGDIFYRDEQGYYYFVERLKMLIKYRNYHVIPPELEAVIIEHPDVLNVSVTCIDHEEDGEHPVAIVVKRPGSNVTAQEIKDLVADKLSDSKKLRGGVVFMDEIPTTSTGKVARGRLRQIVKDAIRE